MNSLCHHWIPRPRNCGYTHQTCIELCDIQKNCLSVVAILDFKMAEPYSWTFSVTIGLLDPKNVGIGVSTISISVLLNEIFNKTGPQGRPFWNPRWPPYGVQFPMSPGLKMLILLYSSHVASFMLLRERLFSHINGNHAANIKIYFCHPQPQRPYS